ncbi:MAG: ABC transporter substrate-binding protein [Myxococcales bacterium]|nr:ABC transporter substrate-binding protein [Polyangiaceae bacterium]MDW8250003.1 ABC transporter substrate-binding protein [Myxococcales bacterium]
MVLSLALAVLVGCDVPVAGPLGVPGNPGAPPQRGGWLQVASYTHVRTLDPAIAFDEVANSIEHFLFAKLLDFSPDGQGFVPDLAENWEVSDDQLRVVFHLRRGVRFHDGVEVLASDVKRSLERALHPDTPCPVSSFYERITGYRDFVQRRASSLSGVKVEGDYTLVIELSEPDSTLLSVLALPTAAPVCRSAGAVYDREFTSHPCGAGPFRFHSWEPGRYIRMERFEGYYQPGRPYLDGIEYAFNVPTFTQRFKFEDGLLDHIRELGEADLARYLASPAWHGLGAWEPARAIHSLFMNTEIPPFDSRPFRKAIAAAIQREQLAMVRPGSVRPASRILPPAIPGHDPSPGQRYDLALALDLMREAGFPYDPVTGRGGYPRELTYVAISDSFDVEAAQILQQHLARIGVRFRIRAQGWPAHLAETSRRRTVAFGSDGWAADFPDPSDFFEPLFSSKAISEEESQNRAFYRNPRLDALLEEARREPSQERRLALYHQAEDMVLDDAPWAVLYSKRWFELWHPYLRGYRIHPARSGDLAFTWIDLQARTAVQGARWAPPLSRGQLALWIRPGGKH